MSIHFSYDDLCTFDNLYLAWRRARSGKTSKYDIMAFERHLENNLIELHKDLTSRRYTHGVYTYFEMFDGKKRAIHKANMRDRVVHQLVYGYLELLYRVEFIADSYSSRINKGAHRAIKTARYFARLVSAGSARSAYVLKGDIRKYFDSIDHDILIAEIQKKVEDREICKLIQIIIGSFSNASGPDIGVPLGNVTSQIFANIYLHPLDLFIKNELHERYYIRYNDDFIIFGVDEERLSNVSKLVKNFLKKQLKLELPDEKVSIRKLKWGVPFLGYVLLSDAVIISKKTKSKIYVGLSQKGLSSYMGILKHASSYGLKQKILSDKRLKGNSGSDSRASFLL